MIFAELTDASVIAIIAALPPTLLALAALIASIRNGQKVEAVHGIVNQQRTDMTNEIKFLRERISIQEETARALASRAGPPIDRPETHLR